MGTGEQLDGASADVPGAVGVIGWSYFGIHEAESMKLSGGCDGCRANRHFACDFAGCECLTCHPHRGMKGSVPQRNEPGFGLPPTVYGEPSIVVLLAGRCEPDGIEMGTRAGMPVVGCGCPVVRKWLTRGYVRCLCGVDINRSIFWEAALSVEVFRPTVHCMEWYPLNCDPEDRYHALECTAKGRLEAAERKDEILANWKTDKPGFFSDDR
jgi:hypothetical protein